MFKFFRRRQEKASLFDQDLELEDLLMLKKELILQKNLELHENFALQQSNYQQSIQDFNSVDMPSQGSTKDPMDQSHGVRENLRSQASKAIVHKLIKNYDDNLAILNQLISDRIEERRILHQNQDKVLILIEAMADDHIISIGNIAEIMDKSEDDVLYFLETLLQKNTELGEIIETTDLTEFKKGNRFRRYLSNALEQIKEEERKLNTLNS
jgi:hypothetical protein